MSNKTVRVAGIGTRDWHRLPTYTREVYLAAAVHAAKKGWIWHTGAAEGADQQGAEAYLNAGGPLLVLYLPWMDYEQDWVERLCVKYEGRVEIHTYTYNLVEWGRSVQTYHPNQSLTQGPFKLHARNWGIIMDPRVNVVVAAPLAKGGRSFAGVTDFGGTGQGIRIAQGEGVPLYNLWYEEHRTQLAEKVQEYLPKVEKVRIYTDGGVSGNGGPGVVGMGGVVQGRGLEYAGREELLRATNNIAELGAVYHTAQLLPEGERAATHLQVVTDSQWVIGALLARFYHSPEKHRLYPQPAPDFKPWKIRENVELVEQTFTILRQYRQVEFLWVKGHNGDPDNERVNELAQRQAGTWKGK